MHAVPRANGFGARGTPGVKAGLAKQPERRSWHGVGPRETMVGHLSEGAIAVRRPLRAGPAGRGGPEAVRAGEAGGELGAVGKECAREGAGGGGGNRR